MPCKSSKFAATLLLAILSFSTPPVSSQISTACTNSILSSFTPCLNYLTGSTNGGGSPTSDCCDALGSLISSSTDCACLIVTGSVPIPINQALAISLPKACKSKPVPLRCRASATPLPGPGPVAFAPSLPPLPPKTTTTTDTGPDSTSQALPPFSSPSPPALTPPAPGADVTPTAQGQNPLLIPNSAVKFFGSYSPSFAVALLVLGANMLIKF